VTSRLTCTSTNDAGTAVVRPVGDVDLATVNDLWLHLAYHLDPSALVVLDCSGITFFGAAGLHVLERADQTAHDVGAVFVLACVDDVLTKLLELVGLAGRLVMVPTVADALDPVHHTIRGAARKCKSAD
jgi:anti-sigma B factor antagonist